MSINITKREPVVTWKVYYEAKSSYEGNFNVPDKPGFQGPFEIFEKAVAAEESCRRWFNEERKLSQTTDRDGKVTDVVKIHDNVNVEIKKFIDGFPAPEEEEQCEVNGDDPIGKQVKARQKKIREEATA